MPDTSPRLGMPYLQPAQAQKHVTHNEALERLDLLVQLVLASVEANDPPASPAEGEAHGLGTAPTGAWAGRPAGTVAAFQGGGWVFVAPKRGWRAWDRAGDRLRVWTGGAWAEAGGGTPGMLETLGINATASPVNRLSVSAPATLLSHEGTDHRLVVNRAGTANTASVLFQSGFSGRAEIGVAGSDRLSMKVSPDGSAWTEALRADPASGIVSLPKGLESLQLAIPFQTVGAVPTPSAGGFVFLSLVEQAFPQAPANAILVYDTGSSPLLQTVWTGSAVTNRGTTTLSGTTGAAGTISVAVKADGKLYVENNFSINQSQFCLTFLNGFRSL